VAKPTLQRFWRQGALEVHKRVSDFFGIEQESLDLYILAPRPLYEVLESDDNWDVFKG